MSALHNAVGPRKVILINSAVYTYAEIVLGESTHLAGDNNVGKTSLINVLQFLYLDPSSQRFPKSRQETIRYYFKQHSYVLFEVDTPTGIKTVGIRGLGPARGYDIQHFIFDGPFDKALFYGAVGDGKEQLREWDDVWGGLAATQGGRLLESSQLRSILIGKAEKGLPRLDLVPTSNFGAFARVFRHLISLRATTDKELREMVLDSIANLKTENRVLDLPRVCGEEFASTKIEEARILRLRRATSLWDALKGKVEERRALLRELPTIHAVLRESCNRQVHTLQGQESSVLMELEHLDLQQRTLRERKITLAKTRDAAVSRESQLGQEVDRLEKLQNKVAEMLTEELLGEAVASASRELGEIELEMRVATEGEPRKAIESRISAANQTLGRLRAQLANPANSWISPVLSEYPADEQLKVLRLINRDLLDLPEGKEGVEVKDSQALHALVGTILASGDLETYESKALRVNLKGVMAPTVSITDPLLIEQKIEKVVATLEKDTALLQGAKNLEHLGREKVRLERQRDELLRDLATKRNAQEEIQRLPGLRADLEEAEIAATRVKKEAAQVEGELEDATNNRQEIESQLNHLRRSLNTLRDSSLQALELLGENLGFDEVPVPEGTHFPVGGELDGRLVDFSEAARRVHSLHGAVREGLEGIDKVLDGLLSGTEEQQLSALEIEMDALPGMEDKLSKQWEVMVKHAGRGFYDLGKDLERVQSRVNEINRRLGKVRVSNLRRVSIQLVEVPGLVEPIRRWTELFEVEGLAEESLSTIRPQLAKYIEDNRQFDLLDMFNLHMEVERADSSKEVYASLSAESTGTGITLKVVLLSMLLRDLIKAKANVTLPLFVDEVDTLDQKNREAILAVARALEFRVIMASPNAVRASRTYFLHETEKGRTYIHEWEVLEVEQAPAGAEETDFDTALDEVVPEGEELLVIDSASEEAGVLIDGQP
ncbi:MAG: hypothetical protein HYZ13_03060 [Acidobacteria bacterium]|nr:hypothetical protein [Acidobacteriota bacterium]